MKELLKRNSKAIAAAVGGALAALGAAILVGDNGVTQEEWGTVLAAVLLPFGVTWVSPANTPKS